MEIPTALMFIGAGLLLAAGIGYAYKQWPVWLKSLNEFAQATQPAVAKTAAPKRGLTALDDKKPTSKLQNRLVPCESMLQVEHEPGRVITLQVTSVEVQKVMRKYRASGWVLTGDEYNCLTLRGKPSEVERAMILQYGADWFYFFQYTDLGTEGALQFHESARAYGKSQTPNVHPIRWQGQTYFMVDTGKSQWVTLSGEGHVPQGPEVMFFRAEADGVVVLIEDTLKLAADSIWVGRKINPDRFIRDILTPDGS